MSAATRTENVSGQGRMPRRALIYAAISLIAVMWVLPTIGLLISSFRTPQEIRATGWWTVIGSILDPSTWTLENYRFVLAEGFGSAFINTLAVTVPAVVIPLTIAAFAAYAFAWMDFPGRNMLFLVVVGLMVVPLQMALIPVLKIYTSLDLTGTFPAIWLAHTGFGLPLATYLLRNYMGSLPSEVMESARVDGANHWLIFTRIVLPLSVPVLASFAIFQFLWVWNDYLVALVFLGTEPDKRVLNVQLATIAGSGDQGLALLPAGAFVTMLLPLAVFFGLQRYFVRGLTAGSVKG